MKIRTICLTACTVWALSCSAAPALADDGAASSTAPVEEGYRITGLVLAGTAGGGVSPWRPPYRDKLFSKALAALFQRDETYQEESGAMGHLDDIVDRADGRDHSLVQQLSQPYPVSPKR